MSKLPEWIETLSVGNSIIDHQHRQLIIFFNRLADFSAARSPKAIAHFHDLLANGMRLLDEHFCDEEQLLRKNQCPSFQIHRAQHNEYREKLAAMHKAGMAGELLAKEIYEFAKHGLITHMRERDLLDKSFLK